MGANPLGSLPSAYRNSAAADFNEDGCLDLAVGAMDGQTVWIHYGRKGGGFRGNLRVPIQGAGPLSTVSADFDKDGHADLAFKDSVAEEVCVLYGDGNGSFSAPQSIVFPQCNPTDLTVADFNGDGWLDMGVNSNSCNTAWVLAGGGGPAKRTFVTQGPYRIGPSGFGSGSIDSGDFNGDGRPDLVRTSVASGGCIQLMYNLGDGRFGEGPGEYIEYGCTTSWPWSLVVGDFDNDGLLDVAYSNGVFDYSVDVRFGQTDGTLSRASVIALPGAPDQLCAGDFNGDGRTDIAAGACNGRSVFLLTSRDDGTTHGTFVVTDVKIGHTSGGMALGDFDASGSLDFATTSRVTNQLTLCTNLSGPPRTFGRINVNTAPEAVLRALFKHDLSDPLVSELNMDADALADAIVAEREGPDGPFTSLDDFFSRMAGSPDMFPPTIVTTGPIYGFCTEAQARFMSNLVTVRTDQWGVRGRVQFFRDDNNDGQRDPDEAIMTDRSFYMVLDRSRQPIYTVLKRYATAERDPAP
jgi:hypothetical protein